MILQYVCSKKNILFNCDTFNTSKYVDINTFEQLAKDVNELKVLIKESVKDQSGTIDDGNQYKIELLEKEITILKDQSISKDTIITSLKNQLNSAKDYINRFSGGCRIYELFTLIKLK